MDRKITGILCTVLSAVIFGVGPLVAGYIYRSGGAPVTVLVLRSCVLPVLFIVLCSQPGESLRVTKAELKKLLLLGTFGATGTPLLLLNSYRLIPSGTATTMHYMYCVFVVLAGVALFHERIYFRTIISAVLCVLGVVLLYTPQLSGSPLGFLFAIGSAVTYAFYVVYMERSNLKAMNPLKLQLYTISIRLLWTVLYAALTGGFHLRIPALAWTIGVLYYSGIGLLAVLLFQMGIRYSGSSSTVIFSTFEPLTSVMVGMFVLGEPFSVQTVLGVAAILTATVLLVVQTRSEAPIKRALEKTLDE